MEKVKKGNILSICTIFSVLQRRDDMTLVWGWFQRRRAVGPVVLKRGRFSKRREE